MHAEQLLRAWYLVDPADEKIMWLMRRLLLAGAEEEGAAAAAATEWVDDGSLPVDGGGALPFYFLDAHEEPAMPDRLFLFGKARAQTLNLKFWTRARSPPRPTACSCLASRVHTSPMNIMCNTYTLQLTCLMLQ